MSWTVYCHMHTESQRRYVGLTKQTMESRWKKHVYAAKSSKGGRWHFPNAIRRYGPAAFEHFVLEVCETLEEANAAEKKWIEKYRTRDLQFGFNLAEGGGSRPHPIRKNPWDDPKYRAKQLARPNLLQTPESRAKNREALNTPESRAKRSRISKEIRSRPSVIAKMTAALANRVLSPETRAKIGAKSKGRKLSPEARRKVSEANRNRSDEVKAKLGRRGWKHSAETRAKIGASVRAARSQPDRA